MIWREPYQPRWFRGGSFPLEGFWLIAWDAEAFASVELWLKLLAPHEPQIGCLEALDFESFLAPRLARQVVALDKAPWLASLDEPFEGRALLLLGDNLHIGPPTEESLEEVLQRLAL